MLAMALFDLRRVLRDEPRGRRSRRRRACPERGDSARLEALEARLAPAVSTWSGALSGLWSNAGNWDTPPDPGNDLVFPATATTFTIANDLPAVTGYGALTIQGSGYQVGGTGITLSGPIDAAQATGSSALNLPIGINAPETVTVDQAGSSLVIGGVVAGTGGLTKEGAGRLVLNASNTYSGTTTIDAGELDVNGNQGGSPVTINSARSWRARGRSARSPRTRGGSGRRPRRRRF